MHDIKPNMSFHSNTVPNLLLLFPLLFSFLLFKGFIGAAAANSTKRISYVGAIVDVNSHTGKELRLAMEVAVQNFNNHSRTHNITLLVRDSGRNPLQAASAAEELIRKKVEAIIGMETWQEATLVAELGDKAQVPVISFSAPSIAPPLMPLRWPFLIHMAKNQTAHVNCIADIVHAYNWQKVIAVYEDDPYSGDSGMLGLLFEALQKISVQIEYRLVLPPFASLSDPKGVVLDELVKILLSKQSRVFIILQASLPMVTHLFREAKKVGFLEKDSAWIINEEIISTLDYVKASVLSSMEGSLGIKTYYDTSSGAYSQFLKIFQAVHIEKVESKPGSDALRAYDSITTVAKAIEKMNTNTSNSRVLLKKILSSNFSGLSGNIRFRESHLSNTPMLRVINVVKKKCIELDFWIPNLKFFRSLKSQKGIEKGLTGPVVWTGGLNSTYPMGWKIPSDDHPLQVAVPIHPAFDNFVKFESQQQYSGFCIDLFYRVRDILRDKYSGLPYKFTPFNVSYDDLLQNIVNESYDAVVGDITILANRSKTVSFTQPYTESGLMLIVPAETEGAAWLFMKPFSWEMWMATGGILTYTMFIIWFLEHQSNQEFGGPWKNQISNTLWFAFSSLFFAHREKIQSNSARVVVGVWLFLVFVLTSSYTASLSSMLTVQRMKSGRDVDWLKHNNLTVGCDNRSTFVRNYLQDVYRFHPQKIIDLNGEHDFVDKFKSKAIAGLFLESPYEKVFLNKYCSQYIVTTAAYKFGGLGFVFQKGSPIAKDFSEAILTLAENGTLKDLEERWLTPSNECSSNSTSAGTESLTLGDFWVLYVISGATSTIFLVLALLKNYLHNFSHRQEEGLGNITASDGSVWTEALKFTSDLYNGSINSLGRAATFGRAQGIRHWNSSRWESISTSDDQGNPRRTQSAGIEMLGISSSNF